MNSVRYIERVLTLSWSVLQARIRRLGEKQLRWAEMEAGLRQPTVLPVRGALWAGSDGGAFRKTPTFGHDRGCSWAYSLRSALFKLIAEGGGRVRLAPGPRFSGAVHGSSAVGEAYAALRLLLFLNVHALSLIHI